MTALLIENLHVALGGRKALDGVSFTAQAGEFIGLIGPNGAGKTTLLRAVLGLAASQGQMALDGRDLRALPAKARAQAIAYLPQEREVAWPVPVHVLCALGRMALKPPFAGLDARDAALVEAAMARMDVAHLRDRPADALSGGERARALIARALAQDTPVLLADEPAAGLDPGHQIGLMDCFAGLAAEGRTVIASLHDLGLAAAHCTRLIVLDKGRVAADGAPAAVLTPALLAAVYGVSAHIMQAEGELVVQPRARLTDLK